MAPELVAHHCGRCQRKIAEAPARASVWCHQCKRWTRPRARAVMSLGRRIVEGIVLLTPPAPRRLP